MEGARERDSPPPPPQWQVSVSLHILLSFYFFPSYASPLSHFFYFCSFLFIPPSCSSLHYLHFLFLPPLTLSFASLHLFLNKHQACVNFFRCRYKEHQWGEREHKRQRKRNRSKRGVNIESELSHNWTLVEKHITEIQIGLNKHNIRLTFSLSASIACDDSEETETCGQI